MAALLRSGGRKRESCVWECFGYEKKEDTSYYQVNKKGKKLEDCSEKETFYETYYWR